MVFHDWTRVDSGTSDPHGIHGALWQQIDPESPMIAFANEAQGTAAACRAGLPVEAFLDPLALAAPLPSMPLFLSLERYINVPLEETYEAAFRGLPAIWRDVLDAAQR